MTSLRSLASFAVKEMEEHQQRSASPKFYRNAATLFFVIGGILLWAAITRHDWVYWAFAAITLLNAVMAILKFRQLRETKS
jgi:membrane protein YdbS with pleckstrin-like domain